MKKVFGFLVLSSSVLLANGGCHFFMMVYAATVSGEAHTSIRQLFICATLFIISLFYLLRWGIRLLK